ncbi:MAG: PD-(D/E)XK nuclease superfamily protein [Polyangiaceae bacterium]
MAGKAVAVANGDGLVKEVVALAEKLGLQTREQFKCSRRIWGAERFIDVVLTEPKSRKRLGVDCKFQRVSGSAEEKIPAVIQDIGAWPIDGIVVFSGEGFSSNIRSFLLASGRAVDLVDLEAWLRLFFGLDLPMDARAKPLPLKTPGGDSSA